MPSTELEIQAITATEYSLFQGPFSCPRCEEDIQYLNYHSLRPEYGRTSLLTLEDEMEEQGDAREYSFICPECEHDVGDPRYIQGMSYRKYLRSGGERLAQPPTRLTIPRTNALPSSEYQSPPEFQSPPPDETNPEELEENQINFPITPLSEDQNTEIKFFKCPKDGTVIFLNNDLRDADRLNLQKETKIILTFKNPVTCPTCYTIFKKQLTLPIQWTYLNSK